MIMETSNLSSIYSKTAQRALFRNVYVWMTMALAITGLVAMYMAKSLTLLQMILGSSFGMWGLLIAEIGLVWYLSARIRQISFTTATVLFIIYSILNGATLSVIFLAYTASSIANTFFITAGTFAATGIYGYVTKKDLSSLGSLCIMGVIGLIIATVVNIFLASDALTIVISYIGVALFVGLTAYDTQKIKRLLLSNDMEVNEETQKIALLGALTLYLDFINLFLYLLRVLGDRK